jgi:hypothetical protein
MRLVFRNGNVRIYIILRAGWLDRLSRRDKFIQG